MYYDHTKGPSRKSAGFSEKPNGLREEENDKCFYRYDSKERWHLIL